MEYVFADSTLVLVNSFLPITLLSSTKPPQPKLIASRKYYCAFKQPSYKSSIAYSKNTTPNIVSSILNSLAVTTNVGSGNYLKLPSMVGRSKKAIFNYVKDRIWKNVNHGVKNHFEWQVKKL